MSYMVGLQGPMYTFSSSLHCRAEIAAAQAFRRGEGRVLRPIGRKPIRPTLSGSWQEQAKRCLPGRRKSRTLQQVPAVTRFEQIGLLSQFEKSWFAESMTFCYIFLSS